MRVRRSRRRAHRGIAVRVSVCVQHHPSRAGLLADLKARVGAIEVVTDPDPDGKPDPLRCYLECLRRTPEWCTHRVVLQDDCWPIVGFATAAAAAISEYPEALVCFFVPALALAGGERVKRARKAGETWAELGNGLAVPVVATAWPRGAARDFVADVEARAFLITRSDDAAVSKFAALRKVRVMAPVPSIVEHPDDVPSLIGDRAANGKNPARRAAFLAPLD